jgi:hypothetical protein
MKIVFIVVYVAFLEASQMALYTEMRDMKTTGIVRVEVRVCSCYRKFHIMAPLRSKERQHILRRWPLVG